MELEYEILSIIFVSILLKAAGIDNQSYISI